MTDIWDMLFNNGSKSVRKRMVLKTTVDAEGNPIVEAVEGETISLSPDGSIDSTRVVPDRFYHCGCNAENPMGGRCAEPECGRVSCVQCFARCHECSKPLCLEHSFVTTSENQGEVTCCRRCSESTQRKRILKTVFAPFVDFEERDQ